MAREKAQAEDFQAEEAVAENTEATVEEKDTISEEIRQAFQTAIDASKEEDMVKIDMIAAGAKFKQVTRIYNELMIEAGLAISKEDKDEIVKKACADADLSTEEGLEAATAAVDAAIESTNAKGAATMVRAYARKNDIECFKKPKSEGGTRTSFLNDFYAALVENPNMTEVEAYEFIVKNGTPNTLRWEKSHQKVRILANKLSAKYSA